MKSRNYVLYILVLVFAGFSFVGCYHGAYSGKAPNSVYRGDNQGTPGLRVQPMEFGLTQAQMETMSPEEFDAYMDKLDRYNESMQKASETEAYDAYSKSHWTRYRIPNPSAPSASPSPSERRALRKLERQSRRMGDVQSGNDGASVMPPQPQRGNFSSEADYRQAYMEWVKIGRDFQRQRKSRY